MFLGRLLCGYPVDEEDVEEGLTLVRQFSEERLVPVVDTLLMLELLYRVEADVEVAPLEDVLVELEDTTELALDPIKRPLRVLFGETAWYRSACGELAISKKVFESGKRLGGGGDKTRVCRGREAEEDAGRFKPIKRLAMAVARDGDGRKAIDGETSSIGGARPIAAALVRVEPPVFPKLSFHLDGFLLREVGDIVDW